MLNTCENIFVPVSCSVYFCLDYMKLCLTNCLVHNVWLPLFIRGFRKLTKKISVGISNLLSLTKHDMSLGISITGTVSHRYRYLEHVLRKMTITLLWLSPPPQWIRSYLGQPLWYVSTADDNGGANWATIRWGWQWQWVTTTTDQDGTGAARRVTPAVAVLRRDRSYCRHRV